MAEAMDELTETLAREGKKCRSTSAKYSTPARKAEFEKKQTMSPTSTIVRNCLTTGYKKTHGKGKAHDEYNQGSLVRRHQKSLPTRRLVVATLVV